MSVGASGVTFFVFNDFEQKLLEKNSTADFIEKKSKKFSIANFIEKNRKKFPLLISLKKNRKKFPLLISLKKNRKNFSTAEFIGKQFPLLISLKNNFVPIYGIFQEVKKKCQISRKFVSLSFLHPTNSFA